MFPLFHVLWGFIGRKKFLNKLWEKQIQVKNVRKRNVREKNVRKKKVRKKFSVKDILRIKKFSVKKMWTKMRKNEKKFV